MTLDQDCSSPSVFTINVRNDVTNVEVFENADDNCDSNVVSLVFANFVNWVNWPVDECIHITEHGYS